MAKRKPKIPATPLADAELESLPEAIKPYVEHGKRFEQARVAAEKAAKPYHEARERLIVDGVIPPEHHDDCSRLLREAELAKLKAFEEHGFRLAEPVKIDTPAKLATAIDERILIYRMITENNGLDSSRLDLRSSAGDLDSRNDFNDFAQALRDADPSLPLLPERLPDPEAHILALRDWCATCSKMTEAMQMEKSDTKSNIPNSGFGNNRPKEVLHDTAKQLLEEIQRHPGQTATQLAPKIGGGITDDHLRRLVSTKLKGLVHNPRGCAGYHAIS